MDSTEVLLLVKKDIENAIPESIANLKVTAVDICDSYIVLGSNSGTLFFLHTENYSFIQKVRTKNGRIIQISINPDKAYLGYASSSGLVYVLQVPGQVPQMTLHPVSSRKHEGSTVTSLAWSHVGRDLYIGDIDGLFSLLHVPLNLASSFILNLSHYLMKLDSGIFQLDVKQQYVLISTFSKSYICNTRLETYSVIGTKSRFGEYGGCICRVKPSGVKPLVQNESFDLSNKLKSNGKVTATPNHNIDQDYKVKFAGDEEHNQKGKFTSRAELLDNRDLNRKIEFTDNELFSNSIETATEAILNEYNDNDKSRQYNVNSLSERIQKFVREEISSNNNNKDRYFNSEKYRVFCSRPGLRVWEADFQGSVIATHQFKNAIPHRQASVITLRNKSQANVDVYLTDKLFLTSLTFKKMLNFFDEYLLANSASAFYLINPNNSKIILWCPVYEGIQDIKTCGNFVLVFTLNSNVYKFQITPIDFAILTLHANGYLYQCADVCLRYPSIFETSYLLKHCFKSIINDIIYHVKDEEIIARINDLKRKIINDLKGVAPINEITLNSESITHVSKDIKVAGSRNKISEDKTKYQTNLNTKNSYLDLSAVLEEVKPRSTSFKYNMEKSSLQDIVTSLALNIASNISSNSSDMFPNSWPLHTGRLLNCADATTVNGEESSSFENVLEYRDRRCEENGTTGEKSIYNPLQEFRRLKGVNIIRSNQRNYCTNEKDNIINIPYLNQKNSARSSVNIVSLPTFLKEFYNTICSVKIILKYFNKSNSVTKALLILFLKEYEEANGKIEIEDIGNTANNDFLSSCIEETSKRVRLSEREHLIKEITHLFLLGLREEIVLVSHINNSNCQERFMEHSLIPKVAKDLDVFYAHLICIDRGLINYRTILNQFHEVEKHLMVRTWLSLMKKTTLISDGVRKVYILPDIEFSRSQRIQYLRFILETNGWDYFMSAVSKIQNSTVLFDIYYFISYFSQNKEIISLYCSLNKYLKCIPCGRIGDLYTKYWSKCPEVQTDIIISLLCDYKEEEFVCQCKYPLPNNLCQEASTTSLVKSMIGLPLYHPQKLFTVFQRKYFYSGIFDIAFRYDVAPFNQLVPFILQSFNKTNIIRLLDRLPPSQYPKLLLIVSKMAGANDTSITCLNCHNPLPICFTSNLSGTKNIYSPEENKKLDKEKEILELKTYSMLWQLVYIKMIKHLGNLECLRILQEMVDKLPQSTFLKRLCIQSIVTALADVSKIQLDVTQLASVPKLQFSSNVRSTLDRALLPAKTFSKNYENHENKSSEHVYLDSDPVLKECVSPSQYNWSENLGSSPPNSLPSSTGFNFTNENPEGTNHHWGVKTQILNGVCQLCQLGLTVDVMVNAGGITVFACGHAYHTICLAQYGRFCVICNRSKVAA